MEDEDKKEGVKGMLDMHLPVDRVLLPGRLSSWNADTRFLTRQDGEAPEGLDDTIDGVIEHWRIKNEEEKARQAEQAEEKTGVQESESESDGEGDIRQYLKEPQMSTETN